jgi:hypothetical protein
LPDADVYFLANTSNVARDVTARFRSRRAHAELWDPFTGRAERLEAPLPDVPLRFDPYSTRIVVFRDATLSSPAAATRAVVASEDLASGWTVTVGQTRRTDVTLPYSWEQDAATRHFSGTTTYDRAFELPSNSRTPGSRIVVDFGTAKAIEREPLPGGTMRGNSFAALVAPPIREAATVFVNGRRVAAIWAPPYRADITQHLRDGANQLRIEVYNTAINVLAEGGRLPDVGAVVERYGQRFRLQDMDGLRPLPSGILSVPKLMVER